jgi:hypothetical protein
MSRSYTSSPPSAYMACSGTTLLYFTLLCQEIGYIIIISVEQRYSCAANNLSANEIPRLYVTRKFIIMYAKACHWTPSTARYPAYLWPIFILSADQRPGLQSGLSRSDIPTTNLYASFVASVCSIPSAYRTIFDLIAMTIFGEEQKL